MHTLLWSNHKRKKSYSYDYCISANMVLFVYLYFCYLYWIVETITYKVFSSECIYLKLIWIRLLKCLDSFYKKDHHHDSNIGRHNTNLRSRSPNLDRILVLKFPLNGKKLFPIQPTTAVWSTIGLVNKVKCFCAYSLAFINPEFYHFTRFITEIPT